VSRPARLASWTRPASSLGQRGAASRARGRRVARGKGQERGASTRQLPPRAAPARAVRPAEEGAGGGTGRTSAGRARGGGGEEGGRGRGRCGWPRGPKRKRPTAARTPGLAFWKRCRCWRAREVSGSWAKAADLEALIPPSRRKVWGQQCHWPDVGRRDFSKFYRKVSALQPPPSPVPTPLPRGLTSRPPKPFKNDLGRAAGPFARLLAALPLPSLAGAGRFPSVQERAGSAPALERSAGKPSEGTAPPLNSPHTEWL
jgi:hypothetical protein